MRERPILFSAPMVRAILEGRKSQTRRAVKPQPPIEPEVWFVNASGDFCTRTVGNCWATVKSPYGVPGDRLWVKETWRPLRAFDPWDLTVRYAADGVERLIPDGEFGVADWTMPKAAARGNVSPLFMPRWASRLTLQVADVRVERLHDISDADAEAEGIREPSLGDEVWFGFLGLPRATCPPKTAFVGLWDSINGEDEARRWAANPWVWVVSFQQVTE